MNAPAGVAANAAANGYVDRTLSAPDGLKLHVRDYGSTHSDALPVVCLPGLTRTCADFHALASALTKAETPRRVIAVDYRGRGLSEHDRDPRNYSAPVELADLRAVLTALEIAPAIFIGTSRGGVLTMLLAAAQPSALAGAVLNDIGPVIEAKGLMRIKGYVGKLPQPRDMAEAGQILKRLFDAQFPKLNDDDWREAAALTWHLAEGRPVLSYDPKLAATLEGVDIERAIPTLWPQFDALRTLPVMVIRGLLSDLLSEATVAAMRTRHPELEVVEAPDEGHPPSLSTPDMIEKLTAFCLACDRATHRT